MSENARLEALRKRLGLPDDASDKEISSAVSELKIPTDDGPPLPYDGSDTEAEARDRLPYAGQALPFFGNQQATRTKPESLSSKIERSGSPETPSGKGKESFPGRKDSNARLVAPEYRNLPEGVNPDFADEAFPGRKTDTGKGLAASDLNVMTSSGDTYNATPDDWTKRFAMGPSSDLKGGGVAPTRDIGDEEPEEKPKDLAAEVEKRVRMANVKPANIQDTSKIDLKVNSLYDQAKMDLASGNMSPEDEESFAAELKRLRGDYNAEKDSIGKREVMHNIIDAITQFSAGAASVSTGRDLTNVKTKQHDFQKDKEFAQEELKTDLTDLKGRRTEDQQKRRDVADMAYKQTSLGLEATKAEQGRINEQNRTEIARYNAESQNAHNVAMIQVYGQRDEGKDENTAAKLWQKWQHDKDTGAEEYRKRGDVAGDEIRKILADKNTNKDEKAAFIQDMLVTKLEIPVERAHAIATRPGFFFGIGERMNTPEEMLPKMSNIIAQEYRIRKLGSQLMPGEVLVMNPETSVMSAAPNAKAVPAGFKIVATTPRAPK